MRHKPAAHLHAWISEHWQCWQQARPLPTGLLATHLLTRSIMRWSASGANALARVNCSMVVPRACRSHVSQLLASHCTVMASMIMASWLPLRTASTMFARSVSVSLARAGMDVVAENSSRHRCIAAFNDTQFAKH
jgi:hypothetical protein